MEEASRGKQDTGGPPKSLVGREIGPPKSLLHGRQRKSTDVNKRRWSPQLKDISHNGDVPFHFTSVVFVCV